VGHVAWEQTGRQGTMNGQGGERVQTIVTALRGVPLLGTLPKTALRGSLELSGPLAEQSLRNVYVDTAFTGVDGLTLWQGLTTYNQAEAYINRVMIGQARRVIAVADHTKLGRVMMALIAPARDIAAVVTDAAAPRDHLDELRAAGIEVVVTDHHAPRADGLLHRLCSVEGGPHSPHALHGGGTRARDARQLRGAGTAGGHAGDVQPAARVHRTLRVERAPEKGRRQGRLRRHGGHHVPH